MVGEGMVSLCVGLILREHIRIKTRLHRGSLRLHWETMPLQMTVACIHLLRSKRLSIGDRRLLIADYICVGKWIVVMLCHRNLLLDRVWLGLEMAVPEVVLVWTDSLKRNLKKKHIERSILRRILY